VLDATCDSDVGTSHKVALMSPNGGERTSSVAVLAPLQHFVLQVLQDGAWKPHHRLHFFLLGRSPCHERPPAP
jgi:hypothetical protein